MSPTLDLTDLCRETRQQGFIVSRRFWLLSSEPVSLATLTCWETSHAHCAAYIYTACKMRRQMSKAIEYLEQELASVRTGRASTGMTDACSLLIVHFWHVNAIFVSCGVLKPCVLCRVVGPHQSTSVWAKHADESSCKHICKGCSDNCCHSIWPLGEGLSISTLTSRLDL